MAETLECEGCKHQFVVMSDDVLWVCPKCGSEQVGLAVPLPQVRPARAARPVGTPDKIRASQVLTALVGVILLLVGFDGIGATTGEASKATPLELVLDGFAVVFFLGSGIVLLFSAIYFAANRGSRIVALIGCTSVTAFCLLIVHQVPKSMDLPDLNQYWALHEVVKPDFDAQQILSRTAAVLVLSAVATFLVIRNFVKISRVREVQDSQPRPRPWISAAAGFAVGMAVLAGALIPPILDVTHGIHTVDTLLAATYENVALCSALALALFWAGAVAWKSSSIPALVTLLVVGSCLAAGMISQVALLTKENDSIGKALVGEFFPRTRASYGALREETWNNSRDMPERASIGANPELVVVLDNTRTITNSVEAIGLMVLLTACSVRLWRRGLMHRLPVIGAAPTFSASRVSGIVMATIASVFCALAGLLILMLTLAQYAVQPAVPTGSGFYQQSAPAAELNLLLLGLGCAYLVAAGVYQYGARMLWAHMRGAAVVTLVMASLHMIGAGINFWFIVAYYRRTWRGLRDPLGLQGAPPSAFISLAMTIMLAVLVMMMIHVLRERGGKAAFPVTMGRTPPSPTSV